MDTKSCPAMHQYTPQHLPIEVPMWEPQQRRERRAMLNKNLKQMKINANGMERG